MFLLQTSLISTLLTLAVSFLSISMAVQVVQEIWKYITNSKSKAYTQVLKDFLGPIAQKLFIQLNHTNLAIRGPFQFLRLSPKGILNPLDQATIISALESTAPPFIKEAIKYLNLECAYQNGKPAKPSADWLGFLSTVGNVKKGSSDYWTANEITEFIKKWSQKPDAHTDNEAELSLKSIFNIDETFDAQKLLLSFRNEFLPQISQIKEQFSQIKINFDFAYKRRNIRQTFVIALVIAILFNLPFQKLYTSASAVPAKEAIESAEKALAIYKDNFSQSDSVSIDKKNIDTLLTASIKNITPEQSLFSLAPLKEVLSSGFKNIIKFLLGCIVTSVFITFGAPFWNDIASFLLHVQKSRKELINGGE